MPSAFATIAGVGGCLPGPQVGNDHFTAYLETTDEWIVSRTGIRGRHFAPEGTCVSELALPAVEQALAAAKLSPADIELIVFATTTPDRVMPSSACLLQRGLGIKDCTAFDIQAVCTGFIYALGVANSMVRSGQAGNALVVGADIYSRILDWQDRSTCMLFGDGAGAVVLARSDTPGISSVALHADGSEADTITTAGFVADGKLQGGGLFTMDGPRVYKIAIKTMVAAAEEVCAKAKIAAGDVDWLVVHQANLRIVDEIGRRLGVHDAKVVRTVIDQANTSAASVPLGLASIWDRVQPGERVLMLAAGSGMTWGAALWQA